MYTKQMNRFTKCIPFLYQFLSYQHFITSSFHSIIPNATLMLPGSGSRNYTSCTNHAHLPFTYSNRKQRPSFNAENKLKGNPKRVNICHMNKVVRTSAIIYSDDIPFHLRQCFFHSSPILERRRRTNWESATRFSNYYNKRSRKLNGKREMLRNVSAFAEELFQNWRNDHEEYHPSSSRSNPWFRQDFSSDRNRGGRPRSSGPKPGSGRRFDFCEDDEFEVEHMFRASFGGNKYFYWSFTSEEPEREYTSSYNTRSQRNRRHPFDDEYNSDESNCSTTDLTSYRLALGLKSSGPLNLEDVKNAYRSCALKWHPDRHQGSSKAVAEEKFKKCSAAYQSLCDQLID